MYVTGPLLLLPLAASGQHIPKTLEDPRMMLLLLMRWDIMVSHPQTAGLDLLYSIIHGIESADSQPAGHTLLLRPQRQALSPLLRNLYLQHICLAPLSAGPRAR